MKCFQPPKAKWSINVDGEVKEARVVEVKDTNSIKLYFPCGSRMYQWKCKFDGLILPIYKSNDPEEKNTGRLTRDAIRNKILGKTLKVTCGRVDIDGKLRMDIHVDGKSMVEWLSENHYDMGNYK